MQYRALSAVWQTFLFLRTLKKPDRRRSVPHRGFVGRIASVTTHKIGVIMNGVTGRMGSRQHLARSILAIRQQGGVKLDDGRTVVPEPILVGRDERKLKSLCDEHGLEA